jgi:cathepsin L
MFKTLATLAIVGFATAQDSEVTKAYHSFLAKHGKNYGTKEEMALRENLFSATYHDVMHHNMFETEKTGITKEVNSFADMTPEEFKNLKGFVDSKKQVGAKAPENITAASSVDWRQKNAVTPVKNQGQCGSCWSFSTTASLEGAHAIKTGKLVAFSEAQLVDCSWLNHGCNGGSMDLAMMYIKNHGLETESAYPYVPKKESCQFDKSKVAGTSTGHVDVTHNSPADLMKAVSLGPVSIAIEADQSVFQSYKSGILKANAGCGTQLDHGVAVVGYGSDNGEDYWIIRNSWGASWGESGYIRFQRESSQGAGVCGLQSQPVYPLV